MAPPKAKDPWLASRRFGIVIDAGSSGSRLQIYSWRDARTVRAEGGRLDVLPKVEKGTKDPQDWISKVEPGLSTFASNVDGIGPYLAPLLAHARDHIPPSAEEETSIFLLATAGLRLLSREQQSAVLGATCDFLRFHSLFKVAEPSARGPCGSHVRIISGEEEGLFGWIAINYLMDGFHRDDHQLDAQTYGFLDMGGASTQIAFEPRPEIRASSDETLHEVRLRLLRGDEISHDVFVTTWLGYGTNQARERYVGHAINDYELTRGVDINEDQILDPCLPKSLRRTETPMHTLDVAEHNRKEHALLGTGSFTECLRRTNALLNKNVECRKPPCLFNGVHVPTIDFDVSRFIGVSEYWYSSEHVFGLGGVYDFVQYERAASDFCGLEWDEIVRRHGETRQAGHIGGDGEVERHGEVVAVGKWGTEVELSRLEMQCFKAAWIVNVLHEGIGLPRVVDPGGNATTEADEVSQKAAQKGLGAPLFQSLDTIDDTAISWTLGKMVLEASKEVPPLSASLAKLRDPMDSQPPTPVETDLPSHHLKSHASSSPLGSWLYPYIAIIFCLAVFARLLRHRIPWLWRRPWRWRRKADVAALEEGRFVTANGFGPSPGGSRSSTPDPERNGNLINAVTQQLRRTVSSRGTHSTTPSLRLIAGNGSRVISPMGSPKRSTFSLHNAVTPNKTNVTAPSPPLGDDETPVRPPHPLQSHTLSRNSSQINLVPRQSASRATSGSLTPSNGLVFDEG